MALYRCPKCGEIVPREDARRCMNCGTVFDMDHEPVLDDGSGKPVNIQKKRRTPRSLRSSLSCSSSWARSSGPLCKRSSS